MANPMASDTAAKPAISEREQRLQAALKRNMARRKEAARRPSEAVETIAKPHQASHE